ncbi:MAG: nicotinate (nicotinamide) nucleotide adenylyltransferase [Mariprofundaceae bacterium]
MAQVALFGGSFDPPHLGHVAMLEAALDILPSEFEVWIVPVGIPIHRTLTASISTKQRLRWVQQVFTQTQRVRVIHWESQSSEATATIDTLRRFHRQYPETMPWLILGADAYAGLETWVGYPEHRKLCSLLVFPRMGTVKSEVLGWQSSETIRSKAGLIYHATATPPAIAATDIRKDAQAGKSLRGRIPKSICHEVEQMYYRGETIDE